MDYSTKITDYLNLLRRSLNTSDMGPVNDFLNLMVSAANGKKRIYICGNGGSASTASHFTSDYTKGLKDYGFDFVCLCDNMAIVTSIANDISYDKVFLHQIWDKITPNDIIIGISGSGNSANVVNALSYAKDIGATTVGITGYDGGKIGRMVDIHIHTPIEDMQVVEDFHLIINHMTMKILREAKKDENSLN